MEMPEGLINIVRQAQEIPNKPNYRIIGTNELLEMVTFLSEMAEALESFVEGNYDAPTWEAEEALKKFKEWK